MLTKELIVFGEKVWQRKSLYSQLLQQSVFVLSAYLLCLYCFCARPDRKAQFNEAAIVLVVAGKLSGIATACPRKTGNTFTRQTGLRKRAHMRTSACIYNGRLATICRLSRNRVRPPKLRKRINM